MLWFIGVLLFFFALAMLFFMARDLWTGAVEADDIALWVPMALLLASIVLMGLGTL